MKKLLVTLLSVLVCLCVAFGLAACGNGNQNNNDSSGNTPIVTHAPTAAEIIKARAKVASENVQGYNFNLTFTGDFGVLGIGSSLSGEYDGAYRYDRSKDEVTFKRTTSGVLLEDSTCYVFTSENSRIKATMDGNTLKKVSVVVAEEQDILMVNLPIIKIVDMLDENSISDITVLKNSDYQYSCKLSAKNNNLLYSALGKVFEKLGTGVSFKGINLVGDTSDLDFNITNGKLNDFHLGFEMQISVKAVNVTLHIDYTQQGSTAEISIPDMANSGLLYKASDMQSEINAINTTIEILKKNAVYSLDLTAENKFDPGWNKLAIVDSYTSRMYKKTENNIDWFNHSYCYKAHSETAGKETYKYTLGNVNGKDEENQGTWLISRKSTNIQTKINSLTADTQFDFLTSAVKQQAGEIDCIRKQVNGTTVTYTLYLGKTATKSVQEKIIGMINTNSYADVIQVDNYFNNENIIKDAIIKIVLKDGKISSVDCDTELCYNPTGGEWTEYNITLNNTIALQVNKNLAKAQEYEVPTKVKGNAIGWGNNLNDGEYYIL